MHMHTNSMESERIFASNNWGRMKQSNEYDSLSWIDEYGLSIHPFILLQF